LPPVLVHLPLLSERPDWEEVRQEEVEAREANNRARSNGRRDIVLGGPSQVRAVFPGPTPLN
jgi:hypothetical protein